MKISIQQIPIAQIFFQISNYLDALIVNCVDADKKRNLSFYVPFDFPKYISQDNSITAVIENDHILYVIAVANRYQKDINIDYEGKLIPNHIVKEIELMIKP